LEFFDESPILFPRIILVYQNVFMGTVVGTIPLDECGRCDEKNQTYKDEYGYFFLHEIPL
jgi:hypothetical protein